MSNLGIEQAMSSLGLEHACTICNKRGARACVRCKASHYCSTDCQVDDWPVHKLLCASFAAFDMSTRPSERHVRAIFFPQDQRKPQVIWIDGSWRNHKDNGGGDNISFLISDTMPETMLVQTDPVLKKRLSDTIEICCRETFMIDGSKPNKSIDPILQTSPGYSYDWRGPIVACHGKQGISPEPYRCRDLSMSDFRYIADYLISYGRLSGDVEASNVTSSQAVVKGVRINCVGDCKVFGRPHYEGVDVASTDPIFDKPWNTTSDIADRIDLPILTRRCPPSLRWTRETELHDFKGDMPHNNPDATFLHLCCDPKANNPPPGSSWGWAGWQWQNEVGSVIVVREDREPLDPIHIEALCQYCRQDVHPLMEDTHGEDGENGENGPLSKDFVLDYICEQTFLNRYHKLCDEKRKEGVRVPAKDPYEV